MRRFLTLECDGDQLAATLDPGESAAGLLIVSGGNEIRVGAHRGMARLAATIAAQGHPVFRFDRRGIGDSEGKNAGFADSGPDIAAALATFRAECPQIARVVAFGNCDAATALVLHGPPVDAYVLANPWVVEPVDDLPPAAAIRDRYARRLRDPAAWTALLTGQIDLKALARGLGRIAAPAPAPAASLADRFAASLAVSDIRTTIVLATRDGTAVTFADVWSSAAFGSVRDRVKMERLDSASHSFAEDNDFNALKSILLDALK